MTSMVDAPGTVAALESTADGRFANIVVESATPCARCSAGRGCGAGLFAGRDGRQHLRLPVPDEISLAVGDHVTIAAAGRSLVAASLVVYGVPLAGLLAGALLATLLAPTDGAALVFAVAGLGVGIWFARRRSKSGCWRDGLTLIRAEPGG